MGINLQSVKHIPAWSLLYRKHLGRGRGDCVSSLRSAVSLAGSTGDVWWHTELEPDWWYKNFTSIGFAWKVFGDEREDSNLVAFSVSSCGNGEVLWFVAKRPGWELWKPCLSSVLSACLGLAHRAVLSLCPNLLGNIDRVGICGCTLFKPCLWL